MIRRRPALGAAVLTAVAVLVAAAPGSLAQSQAPDKLNVYGAFATAIEEPWDGAINQALQAQADTGRIAYDYLDAIGYEGTMERELTQIAEKKPDIIFGDAFVNEAAVLKVASQYPEIAFVFGSDTNFAPPNLSVFDNWIHESAYLAGMLAGGLTKSNVIGVVAAMPIAEVNRLVHAYIAGARSVNKAVDVKVSFINSFYDPGLAKEAAEAQIGAGADVLYAERDGVIPAAQEHNLIAIGNMLDQKSQAPGNVVTSVLWNMAPTVEYVLDQVEAGSYTAQDLKDFSSFARGGSAIADINTDVPGGVPQPLIDQVKAKAAEIASGAYRVDIDESAPAADNPGAASPAP